MEAKEELELAVGIDFGSSKTVVSYQESSSAHFDPFLLCLHESPIIPSAIAYISDEQCCIGQAAENCSDCIYWLKHLLHESCKIDDSGDTPIQDVVRMVRNRLPQRQRDNPYILVADFLRALLVHLRTELACSLNLKDLHRVYTFTVPATWSEHTRMMMKKAIQLAGFEHQNATVRLTTEAEAVAMYAVNDSRFNTELCEIHDGVIVCDCGASTIDLTAFFVDQIHPSFEYQRLTAYTSQAWGGVQLQSLIYEKLRTQERQMITRSRRRAEFIDSPFSEWASKTFPRGPATVIDLNFLDLLDLPKEKIAKCYIELAERIVGFIRQQVDCAAIYVGRDVIKKLVLVGGLTQSDEISRMIQNMVETELKIRVESS